MNDSAEILEKIEDGVAILLDGGKKDRTMGFCNVISHRFSPPALPCIQTWEGFPMAPTPHLN